MSNKIHLLYADDDPVIRRIIGGELAKKGFEVIYAEDGNEARDIARRLQPELVIVDYRMPIIDGLKLIKYLKKEEPTKHMPIILLTNEDLSVEGQKMWSEGGFDAYVHKSEGPDALYEKIAVVMKKYNLPMPHPQVPGASKE